MNPFEQSEETLFLQCLELPPRERETFLDTSCGGNTALRDRVLTLLRSHEKSGRFFDSLADKDMAAVEACLKRFASADERMGDQIGRYRLVERIGEGAWGTVWRAEQTEDFKRDVAIKILKLGLDTKEFLIRFEAERKMLALMDHPHIATIYDAGATVTGRPYLVMELIQGRALLDHADVRKLGVDDRIALYIKLCQALDHAHQKGVIHRDIKPSNMLVHETDEAPVPKVIDFGVAKTNQFNLGDKTLFTSIHTFIGTPLYSSPEQLEFSGRDVDERSDVYSLGAVLYELLAGVSPYDQSRLSKQSLEGMRTIIRETDPLMPSTRFSRLHPEIQNRIADERDSLPAPLEYKLKGDLDWVIMKCLEKDRTRRYDTAASLVEDLKAYLEMKPVSAAAPSVIYRTKKYIRRKRLDRLAWIAIPVAVLCVLAMMVFMKGRTALIESGAFNGAAIEEKSPSIAILPFEIYGPGSGNESLENDLQIQLTDGLHNELTTSISKIRNLRTVARNSTSLYRGTTKPHREVADELAVASLLTGVVEWMGNQLRINVQLIDPHSDSSLWGESYVREFTPENIFALQSDISRAVASQLNVQLTPEETQSIGGVPTQSLEAYQAYLKGNDIRTKDNKAKMPEAIQLLEQAVELDPNFTLAWAALADSWSKNTRPFADLQFRVPVEKIRKHVVEAAEKAFELNYNLPEVQVLQGQVYELASSESLDLAETAYRRAIDLNPNYAEAHFRLGLLLRTIQGGLTASESREKFGGESLQETLNAGFQELVNVFSRAVELDPTNSGAHRALAEVYAEQGLLQKRIDQLMVSIELNPHDNRTYRLLGNSLAGFNGQHDQAIVTYRRAIPIDPNDEVNYLKISHAYLHLGDNEQALAWVRRFRQQIGEDSPDSIFQAYSLDLDGKYEEAIELARKMPNWQNSHIEPWLRNDYLRSGRHQEARARYLKLFPELFEPDFDILDPNESLNSPRRFTPWTLKIASILLATGETAQANHLIDETMRYYQTIGHGLSRPLVFIAALRGDKQGAIGALRAAFEDGWRDRTVLMDARLDFLRSEPEFLEIVDLFEADMAVQLANVRRMQSSGELEAIPPVSAEPDRPRDEYDKAIVSFRKDLARYPDDGSIYTQLADAYFHLGDYEMALEWWNRYRGVVGESAMNSTQRAHLYRLSGEYDLALKLYRQGAWPDVSMGPWLLNDDLRNGRFQQARLRYFEAYPKFFEPDFYTFGDHGSMTGDYPTISQIAMEIAPILIGTGETEQAESLMNQAWRYYNSMKKTFQREVYRAWMFALRGDKQSALKEIRTAFDDGFRKRDYFMDARLDSLREDPEFAEILELFEMDMAEQLSNVRRMEANGELEPIPAL